MAIETEEQKKIRMAADKEFFKKSEKSFSEFKIIALIIIGALIIFAMKKPSSKVEGYDPYRSQSVNRAIESADIRSDYTLTKDGVKDVAEKASLSYERNKDR